MKQKSHDTSTPYYYSDGDGPECGPLPVNTITAAQHAGRLSGNVKVRRQADGHWMELSRINDPFERPAAAPAVAAETKWEVSDHPQYGMLMLMAVLLPVCGLIMGMIYLAKDAPNDRAMGAQAIVTSVLISVLVTIGWFVIFHLR